METTGTVKEITEVQIKRAMFARELEERQKRKLELQKIIDNEKSPYNKFKLRLRKFCMYILNKE
jgi:hypothetical protein